MALWRAVAFVLVSLWLAAPAAADTRVALVIGNSAYAGVGALTNPTGDSELMAQTLRDDGFRVTLVQNTTRAQMLQALQDFNDEADHADWALVYYAGHGMEVGGVNYLLPTDVKLRTDRAAQDEAVSLNRVLETVEGAKKLRLVILDACRNNPFADAMTRTARVRSVDRGLAPAEPQGGVIVVYAAAAGQVAQDGDDQHSPFTSALVKRLREPGLETHRLFDIVTADVLDATHQRQRPFEYGSNPSREEFFFKPPAPVVAKPDAGLEQVWGFLKTSTDAPTLKAFLDRLPADHPLRGEVEARMATLGGSKPKAEEGMQVAAIPAAPPSVVAPRVSEPTDCDRLAADPDDPDLPKGFPGVRPPGLNLTNAAAAVASCRVAWQATPDARRLSFQLGRALDRANNGAEAKVVLERAASLGSAAAMLELGYMYRGGLGVPQNFAMARE